MKIIHTFKIFKSRVYININGPQPMYKLCRWYTTYYEPQPSNQEHGNIHSAFNKNFINH